MKELFDEVSIGCSRLATKTYSTSFSLGIFCLHPVLRDPIHSIYGFVRFADEIVDSFHDYNKQALLDKFRRDTWEAIESRISLNPILNCFQSVVHAFSIDHQLIHQFLRSMEMDLQKKSYEDLEYQEYILGSAEVVGLMCLKVFCGEKTAAYEELKTYAMSLGAAFQKVNFLRDLKADFSGLGRTYFPGLDINHFDEASKKNIEASIEADFREAFTGIKKLPRTSRFGVYVAYVYYLALFRKIKNTPSEEVLTSRIRIRNRQKATLLAYSFVKHQLNLI
jgi:15-cis-phytoene synthase